MPYPSSDPLEKNVTVGLSKPGHVMVGELTNSALSCCHGPSSEAENRMLVVLRVHLPCTKSRPCPPPARAATEKNKKKQEEEEEEEEEEQMGHHAG